MDDDRALVAALLAGDEAVFSALVERLHGRIVRLCRRFVASDAAACETLKPTFEIPKKPAGLLALMPSL